MKQTEYVHMPKPVSPEPVRSGTLSLSPVMKPDRHPRLRQLPAPTKVTKPKPPVKRKIWAWPPGARPTALKTKPKPKPKQRAKPTPKPTPKPKPKPIPTPTVIPQNKNKNTSEIDNCSDHPSDYGEDILDGFETWFSESDMLQDDDDAKLEME